MPTFLLFPSFWFLLFVLAEGERNREHKRQEERKERERKRERRGRERLRITDIERDSPREENFS
jgi:di/tricarboxylate transporter